MEKKYSSGSGTDHCLDGFQGQLVGGRGAAGLETRGHLIQKLSYSLSAHLPPPWLNPVLVLCAPALRWLQGHVGR